MTWTKLSDDFGDDCWTLSDAAFRCHIEGLGWSNRKLLDLRIPKDDLRRFAKHPGAVAELVATGWWSDVGDAYLIRHHAQYQRLRKDVVKQQETNASNGRKGGRPRKPREQVADLAPPETESVSDSLSESKTERDGTGRDRSGRGNQRTTHLRAQPPPNMGQCSDCDHREPLDDNGRCTDCARQRRAG